jgi:hypothetical protein
MQEIASTVKNSKTRLDLEIMIRVDLSAESVVKGFCSLAV